MAEAQLVEKGQDAITDVPGRSRGTRVRRTVFALFVPVMLTVYLAAAAPTMLTAVRSLTSANPMWLLAGLASTILSMVAFAMLRGRTLAAGGARIPLRRNVAISYGAGAVHTTLPAGAVFSTTYAFRHLRSWGASAPATTWSMAVTGLLSTLTLSAVGLLGIALSAGTGDSVILPILEIMLALAMVLALVRIAHHPETATRLALLVLARINRFRGRPAQSGVARLCEVVADLRSIRPSVRDWTVAAGLAAANWALDLACLAACCAAVGVHIGFPGLLITYTAGMAAGSLLPLPAGVGAVETAMTLGLTVAGAAASPAVAAVLLYRLLSTGSVLAVGWLVIAAQRIHPAHATTTSAPGRISVGLQPAQYAGAR